VTVAEISAEQARAQLKASGTLLGRWQGPEQFDQTNFLALWVYNSRPFNMDRPIESMLLVLKYRLTVTVAPYVSVSPDAPQNFLQQIITQGQHKDYGGITPINMTGATAFMWPRLFQSTGADTIINGVRAAEPGRPYTSPFTGAIGTYDIVQTYHVPFGPMLGPGQSTKRVLTNFLLQPLDWNDAIRLQLRFGDASAFGDPTGATTAFAGFGGVGTPLLGVYFNYAILGDLRNQMRAGVMFRNEQALTTFQVVAANQRLQDLQHKITTNLVIKSGLGQAAGLTANVATFGSYSDVQLDRTRIVVDNKAIRDNQDNFVEKAFYERMFNTVHPTGHLVESFVDAQNPLNAYRGDGLPGGANFALYTDILTASANNRQNFVQEYCQGGPFPAR
jgi:hypothetical protein